MVDNMIRYRKYELKYMAQRFVRLAKSTDGKGQRRKFYRWANDIVQLIEDRKSETLAEGIQHAFEREFNEQTPQRIWEAFITHKRNRRSSR